MNEEIVGHVFHVEGIYEPDEIVVTLFDDAEGPVRTDFIFIKTEKENVLFQVKCPLFEYESFGYEKEAIQKRQWEKIYDKEKLRRAFVAKQIGFFDKKGNIQPYLEAIPPMAPAVMPSTDKVKEIILPKTKYQLELGNRYPKNDIKIYLDLERLIRQGLLITGGVGTGKTTTLGSALYNLLQIEGIKPHILIIDPDGELASKEIMDLAEKKNGYIQLSCSKKSNFVREKIYDPRSFAKKISEIFGRGYGPGSTVIKTIFACAQTAESNDVPLTLENFRRIIDDFCVNEETKNEILEVWEEKKSGALIRKTAKGGYDIIDLLKKRTIVHIDGSTGDDFNNFLYATLVALEVSFNAAVKGEVGILVVIDEAHMLAPQFDSDFSGDHNIHRDLKKILKSRIATTGPRNGMTLWLTTQRLAKLDKTLSTQTGQNLIAHGCEDVDFKRLIEIVGPEYASSARILPRGYALVKSTGLRLFSAPILVNINKRVDVKSSETSLLKRWSKGYRNGKQTEKDAKVFMGDQE